MAKRKNLPLYHWSPRDRRVSVIRYGLRPSMPSTTSDEWRAPYVCFADSPSWAWALGPGFSGEPGHEYDLWQTWLDDLVDPKVMRDLERPSGIYEVRTFDRVFKSDLWHAGTRTVPSKRKAST